MFKRPHAHILSLCLLLAWEHQILAHIVPCWLSLGLSTSSLEFSHKSPVNTITSGSIDSRSKAFNLYGETL